MTDQLQPLPWQRVGLSVPDTYDLLLSGGRGGGKSTFLIMLIIRDAIRFGKGYVGVLVRKDLSGLKKLEKELLEQVQLTPELSKSKYLATAKEMKFSSGAFLYLHYIKDEASFGRFQGMDLSHVYIDESGQIPDPAPILRLRSSMRTTAPGVTPRMVLTCNPNNVGSWFHWDFIISRLTPWKPGYIELFRKEMVLIHSTLFDNPFIQNREDYIEALKASCNFDEAKIQSEVYGSWGAVSGSFFGHVWDLNRIRVPDIGGLPVHDPNFNPRDVWLSCDWGTRAPASVLLAWRPRTPIVWAGQNIGANSVILVDEIYTDLRTPDGSRQWNTGDRRNTTESMAQRIIEMCRRNGVEINQIPRQHRVIDAAVGAEIGSRDGSIGQQLADSGAAFIAAPKMRRPNGWQLVAKYLEAAGDATTAALYATPAVESFFATVPNLVHAENDPEDLDSTGPDHTADSLRYMLTSMHDPRYRGNGLMVLDGKEGRPLVRTY